MSRDRYSWAVRDSNELKKKKASCSARTKFWGILFSYTTGAAEFFFFLFVVFESVINLLDVCGSLTSPSHTLQ